MIDIHAHILPGIDDGARDIYETVEMAAMAAASGTSTIVATPHSNFPGKYDTYFGDAYIAAYELAVEAVRKEGIPITICPGMEVFATYNLPELLVDKKIMPINQSRYVLIEFAFGEDPDYATDILKRVKEVGAKPVVAHAERYEFIRDNLQLAYEWRKEGYQIQVNKGSVTGKFGRTFCEVANALLNHNLVSVIASDAHGTMARTCEMRDAYKILAREYDERYLHILFEENPRRICANLDTVRMPIKSFKIA